MRVVAEFASADAGVMRSGRLSVVVEAVFCIWF
jgi:hypothetical protein